MDYAYDKNSQITRLTYPDGSTTIDFTRTSLDQIDLVKRGAGTLVDYDYVGSRMTRLMYPSMFPVTGTPLYDGVGRMTRLTWAKSGNTLPDYSYDYDNVGNILTKTHQHLASPDGEDYSYDSLHRLTHTVYGHRDSDPYHGFTYDDLGNRLTFNNNGSPTEYLHNGINEMTKVGNDEQEYDPAGNLTKDAAGYRYFYDYENRLTKIEEADATDVAAFQYDIFNRRIEKIDYYADPDVTRRYYYDQDQRVLEEYDDDGTPVAQASYIWGSYVDQLLAIDNDPPQEDGFEYFVCYDHLFSPVVIVTSSGAITERYDYDVYGKATIYTGDGGDSDWWDGDETTADTSAIDNPYLFTGRRLDVFDDGENVFDIMYYRARYYDTDTGRFISRDPVGYEDGMSLYEYARSMPTVSMDPTGLLKVILSGGYGGYAGFGWSIDGAYTKEEKDCCKDGKLIKNGILEEKMEATGHAGLGFGGHVNIAGVNASLEIKGPGVEVKISGVSLTNKCEDSTDCHMACGSVDILWGTDSTVGAGLVRASFRGGFNGSFEACYNFSGCPKPGWAIGFCGRIDAKLTWQFGLTGDTIDLMPPPKKNPGDPDPPRCYMLKGTEDMLQ